jgi:hypothetical protein
MKEKGKRKEIALNNNVACFYTFWLHFPLYFVFFPNCESCVPNGDVATLVITTHMHFISQLYIFKNTFFLSSNYKTCCYMFAMEGITTHCAMAKDSKLFTIVVQ